jgi:enediyne core biosynthesis thioesterase
VTAYEYEHVVGFEETSLVGNVYFTNYLLWQGHCRELFLRDSAPEVLHMMARREVMFFTHSCSCEYIGEWGFAPLDRVLIRMRLDAFRGGRLTLAFDYHNAERGEELVARGLQEIYCKAQRDGEWYPEVFPVPLVEALLGFAETDQLRAGLREALEHHRARART